MKRRTLTAAQVKDMKRVHETKMLRCSKCQTELVKTDVEIASVLCWRCTAALVPIEKKVLIVKSDRPKGWHWMPVFTDADGTVYHRGVEQPDLKGTLPPTDVAAIKAAQKAKAKEKKAHKFEREEKHEQRLLKEFEKKKKLKKKEEARLEKEQAKALDNEKTNNQFFETE